MRAKQNGEVKSDSKFKGVGEFIKNSLTFKIISICVIVLVLLIPASMIESLLTERETRRDSVVKEISQKWGDQQTITGPFITVPYTHIYNDEDKNYRIEYIHILPDTLSVKGNINPHIRYRGIYEAVLYNTEIDIEGTFSVPDLSKINVNNELVLWDKAVLAIGITDMKGIKESINVKFDNKDYSVNPGLSTIDIASDGVRSFIPLSQADHKKTFSLKLNINGSELIEFIPLGKETEVFMKSTWASPSFSGVFLPTEREVNEKGFSAAWKVLHLNRNFPQFWKGNRHKVSNSSFGVRLLITADVYQKSIRLFKYILMFIVFTFSAFFFAEIINRKKIHPIQYILVGLAVLLFYILLISISEHINFNYAYILSSMAITCIITGYSKGILKSNKFSLTVFLTLTFLYLYLYAILQLSDYALLFGSLGLFIILSFIMYVTRKIDWYALSNGKKSEKDDTHDLELTE